MILYPKIDLYVDGSYLKDVTGWGFVAVVNDIAVNEAYGYVHKRDCGGTRNIAGELNAAIQGLEWCYGKAEQIIVYHDYTGIAKWALKEWKANKPVTLNYVSFYDEYCQRDNAPLVTFTWVKGHSGNKWNEHADVLAAHGSTSFVKHRN